MELTHTLALCLATASLSSAQARPDFSGEWVRNDSAEQRSVASVGDAAFQVGTPGTGWGSPLAIRQDANRIVVEYEFFGRYDLQPKLSLNFALDGSESQNPIMLSHAASMLRSHTSWRDSSLVITTTFPTPPGVNGGSQVRQILTLQSPSTLLVTTERDGVAGSPPIVLNTVYNRR